MESREESPIRAVSAPAKRKRHVEWKQFSHSGMMGYSYRENGANYDFRVRNGKVFRVLELPSFVQVINYEKTKKISAFSDVLVLEKDDKERKKCINCSKLIRVFGPSTCKACTAFLQSNEREIKRKETVYKVKPIHSNVCPFCEKEVGSNASGGMTKHLLEYHSLEDYIIKK